MSGPVISVSRMRILEGGLELLKEFTRESVAFFEANEPRVVGICVFIDEDGTEARSFQIHPDSESYENHLEVAKSQIHEAYNYIEALSWDIFGTPSDSLLRKLEPFGETMNVVPLEAGFLRAATAATTSHEPIILVSAMRIREGGLEPFKQFTRASMAYFEANEPRPVGISVYIDEDGTNTYGINIHPDSESHERHLDVAQTVASQGHEAYDYIEPGTMELFGTVNDSLRTKLEAHYGMRWSESMSVVPFCAGFVRSPTG